MKKNKMMRLASCLLVLCLLSTCAISGTFAKYVTTDSASDTARVAKFGVVVTAEGSLFDKTYVKVTNTPGTAGATNLTVESSNDDNLVAPGTKNDTGITFSITGEPEVSVKVEIDVTDSAGGQIKDVFLKKNSKLPDMTTGDEGDTFDFDNDADDYYYPIVYTLKKVGVEDPVAEGKLSEIETYLESLPKDSEGLTKEYPANTNLNVEFGTYTLTWEWDFDDEGKGTYDKQDTLLGDLAAGTTLKPDPDPALIKGTDYNLTTDIKISITVTQID